MVVVSSCREVFPEVEERAQPSLFVATGSVYRAAHSNGTARVKWEEGGDDVKSAWPLYPGLHTCYNAYYNGTPSRKAEQILTKVGPVRIEGCNSSS